jgi:hypothetical protein
MRKHDCGCDKCDYGDTLRLRVREELLQALEAFVRACDDDEELTQNNADLWDAYEQARKVLLDPIVTHPGGYENQHYHEYGWQPEDGCETCEDYREEQAKAEAMVEGMKQAGPRGAAP